MHESDLIPRDRTLPAEERTARQSRRKWLKHSTALFTTVAFLSCSHKNPRVAYVDSNDPEEESGKRALATIRAEFAGQDVELTVHHLDAARNPAALSPEAERLANVLRKSKPGVILVSGAGAMRSLVAPYLRDGPIPVLFRNIEWTAEPYHVPTRFVTGILDIPPIDEAIRLVKAGTPAARDLFVLSGNTAMDREHERFSSSLYWAAGLSTTYGLVDDFDHWKRAFVWANRHADAILAVNHDAIKGWSDTEALSHIREHIRVPVFCCDATMIRYSVVGAGRIAGESAQWAARQALRVLAGTKVEDIPLSRTTQSNVLVNRELAERIGFPLPSGDALNRGAG
ncbi:MAG: hypothetical protein LC114_23435 [Bryobacterales bacterium]|nr:hypothetical protein [Bryobacterales bacterium]